MVDSLAREETGRRGLTRMPVVLSDKAQHLLIIWLAKKES
jgi:hypothetical protein